MEKLSGLVLQLKVKTGFIVSDDLDEVVDDMLQNLVDDNQVTIDNIRQRIPIEQRLGVYNTKIAEFNQIQDIDTKFFSFTALREHARVNFAPAAGKTVDDYEFYKVIEKEMKNLIREYKSNLNTNKIMSTTAFEKLNVISDTIPNIINQILSLALGISKVVLTKITEWSTEITNEDLSKVIDTSNELIEDVALINSKAGIQPYITIYKKLKKPIEDIYKSVNEMGKLAGVISYDDNVKNQFKYTNTIGYTNRTGPRPLVPGAAPSARLAPPAAPSTRLTPPPAPITRLTPPPPALLKIKKTINKIGALFKAGNVPEFASSFTKLILELIDILENEALLTDQTPDGDPLKMLIAGLHEAGGDLSNRPIDTILSDDEQQEMDDNFDLYFDYISAMYSQKTTGASGVGETKGAGKFMHSYHAKRFL
jgi:hypothetical protein